MKHLPGHTFVPFVLVITAVHLACNASASPFDDIPSGRDLPGNDKILVEKLVPEGKGGHGYRLVYRVGVPVSVYWKFKTDFDNDFIVENKFIRDHRVIAQTENTAITENRYANGPDVPYRWKTKLFPERFRLDFILLNPEQCRQKYHHGYIQLEPDGDTTLVTQVAYFDFRGAHIWAHYPWRGGMKDFLSYTARWEQAIVLRLKDRYHEKQNTGK